MRVRCFPETEALAPIQNAGTDNRHFQHRMQIKPFDKCRSRNCGVPACHSAQACFSAEIYRKMAYRSGWKSHLERRKSSQDYRGLIREEDPVPRVYKIRTEMRLIPAHKSVRLLQR